MTKLTLITLLTFSFTSIASNNKGSFILEKAKTSKTIISENLNQIKSSNCEDDCYLEFDDCTEGLPPQSVEYEYCEMELSFCLGYCP